MKLKLFCVSPPASCCLTVGRIFSVKVSECFHKKDLLVPLARLTLILVIENIDENKAGRDYPGGPTS